MLLDEKTIIKQAGNHEMSYLWRRKRRHSLDAFMLKKISSSDDRSACKINQEVTPMDKAALQKHEIYNKLMGLEEPELGAIVDYIDFMRHKKNSEKKKLLSLKES
jgi:hypothetical protein